MLIRTAWDYIVLRTSLIMLAVRANWLKAAMAHNDKARVTPLVNIMAKATRGV